jgi:ribosomal protein S18 acetylase RimI-like enzyme
MAGEAFDITHDDTSPTVESPTVADVEVLADLWVDLARDQLDYGSHLRPSSNRGLVRDTIAHHVTTDGLLVARAADDAERDIVGFVMFSLETGQYDQDVVRGVIQNLYVLPNYRGAGVGGALLTAAETALADADADVVTLDAMAENEAARRFYRRHGYDAHRVELEKRVESDNKTRQDG